MSGQGEMNRGARTTLASRCSPAQAEVADKSLLRRAPRTPRLEQAFDQDDPFPVGPAFLFEFLLHVLGLFGSDMNRGFAEREGMHVFQIAQIVLQT